VRGRAGRRGAAARSSRRAESSKSLLPGLVISLLGSLRDEGADFDHGPGNKTMFHACRMRHDASAEGPGSAPRPKSSPSAEVLHEVKAAKLRQAYEGTPISVSESRTRRRSRPKRRLDRMDASAVPRHARARARRDAASPLPLRQVRLRTSSQVS